jgi:hypothetical protein
MPSLLSETEKNNLTPLLEDLFDTFARDIVIHKEPTKKITSNPQTHLIGYDENAIAENVEYIPESQIFKAKVKYNSDQDLNKFKELENTISRGIVKIKVRKSARDYILDGRKVEKIQIDGNFFNIISDESVKKFFNTSFYVFFLQRTL